MRLQRRDSKVVLFSSGNTAHCRVARFRAREKCVTSRAARLHSVYERPTNMAVKNRQLIQGRKKEIDLRSLAESVSETNATLALPAIGFRFDEYNPRCDRVGHEYGKVEAKPWHNHRCSIALKMGLDYGG